MLIISGIVIIADNRRITPQEKSIQLAKSFNIPKDDLAKSITPNESSNCVGTCNPIPKSKIKLAITSIIPSPLTNMFFKPYIPF